MFSYFLILSKILSFSKLSEEDKDKIEECLLSADVGWELTDKIINNLKNNDNTRIIYPSPQGQLWSHKKAIENSNFDNLIFICGHYKDIDQRVIDKYVTNEYSIGDYVVTNGEIPAMIMVDSIVRLIPGVLNNYDSLSKDYNH